MASRTRAKVRRAGRPRSRPRAHAPVDLRSDDPLYLQVVRALKEEIVRGVYPVGSQLPPEDELKRHFSVSRHTVREALRRLREDNLVSSRQGSGTTVVSPSPSDSFVHEVTSINDLVTFAAGVRFAIESIELIEVDRKLAAHIGVKSGDQWLAIQGYRNTEGSELPVCRTEVYISREFAGVGRLLHRHAGPIFHLIEDMFGQPIVEVQQEIAAAPMSAEMAKGLRAKDEAMALEVRRIYKLASGRIALIAINTHPASRFRHSMTMRRVKG
jgi:DNA-binding GntR family transcriptional regulator